MAHILAIAVGLGSFGLYMAAFFLPEVHRKYDFIWSGVAMFYALVLWVCDGRMTGGVLLGQMASVALLGWLGWQTLQLRRQLTPVGQKTPIPTLKRSPGQVMQDAVQRLRRPAKPKGAKPVVQSTVTSPAPVGDPGQTPTAPVAAVSQEDNNDSWFDDQGSEDVTDPTMGVASVSVPEQADPVVLEISTDAAIATPIPTPVEEIPIAVVLEDEPSSLFEEDLGDELAPVSDEIPSEPSEAPEAAAENGHVPADGTMPVTNGHRPSGGAIASESLALRKPLVIKAEIIGLDTSTPSDAAASVSDADDATPPSFSKRLDGDDEEWF